MSRKNEEDIVTVQTKGGFTFKRKRGDEPYEAPQYQRVKKQEDRAINDEAPIKITLKKPIQTKDIRGESRENKENQEEGNNSKQKKVVVNTLKENSKETKQVVLKESDRNNRQEERKKERAEKEQEVQLVKAPPLKDDLPTEVRSSSELAFVKLPSYPMSFIPLEFEIEVYERDNPYKRLARMVSELCQKEMTLLAVEYKEHTFFLKMMGKFVKRLEFDFGRKLEVSVRERTTSGRVLKENLQNVFERQKRKVIEKLIQEYSKGNQIMIEFQETTMNRGRMNEIIESYFKYIKNENQLILESPLSKRLEAQREEIERKSSQKIKTSIQELGNHEKQMDTLQKETHNLLEKYEQQKRKAYDKIFKDYIPIIECDPEDLLKNFFAF